MQASRTRSRRRANDADNDTLGFTIQNRPSWASFDTATGRLSGTPTSANVGAFNNIVISVSDGRASASLAGVQHHRERRGERSADDLRRADDQRQCGVGVQLPAERVRIPMAIR